MSQDGKSRQRKPGVTGAVKAVLAAGLNVKSVEIDKDGRIIVVVGEPEQQSSDPEIVL
jgi:DNA helicase TIP49 (TBP-interacting protein)